MCFSSFIRSIHVIPSRPVNAQGARVIISQFCKVDPKQSSPREAFKLLFMLLELLAMECDNATVAGLFWVVDARDVSMEQMLQYDPFLLKKSFMFVDQCLPLRFTEIHLVNMIPSGQTVFNFVTSFLPAKLPWKVCVSCPFCPKLMPLMCFLLASSSWCTRNPRICTSIYPLRP